MEQFFENNISSGSGGYKTPRGGNSSKKSFDRGKIKEKRDMYLNCKTKSINAEVWFCDELLLKINHLVPILEVLGFFSTNVAQFKDFITRESFSYINSFPIKATIPLFYTVNTNIIFQDFSFK